MIYPPIPQSCPISADNAFFFTQQYYTHKFFPGMWFLFSANLGRAEILVDRSESFHKTKDRGFFAIVRSPQYRMGDNIHSLKLDSWLKQSCGCRLSHFLALVKKGVGFSRVTWPANVAFRLALDNEGTSKAVDHLTHHGPCKLSCNISNL